MKQKPPPHPDTARSLYRFLGLSDTTAERALRLRNKSVEFNACQELRSAATSEKSECLENLSDPRRGKTELSDLEQRIRERAYEIWMDEGRPEGRADVHWQMARELIAIEDNTPLILRPAPPEGAEAPAGEPLQSRSEAWFGFGRRG